MFRHLFILLFSVLFWPAVFGQNALLKEADTYFEKQQHRKALNAYTIYNRNKPGNETILTRLGICHYHVGNTQLARQSLTALAQASKKPLPEVYLYLAKSAHADGDFLEASEQYKVYLSKTKMDDPMRAHVRDAIRRCGTGIQLEATRANAIVENIGSSINTRYDDYAAVLSRTYDDRIYFSSIRSSNIGGLQDDKGQIDLKYGQYRSDIFSATIVNGSWDEVSRLERGINSQNDDQVLDFSPDGQSLVYWKSINGFAGEILVDTFAQDGELKRGKVNMPINGNHGDGGLTFYNDTTVLFYSNRPGGHGGFDIYASFYNGSTWSKAYNLGPDINSTYDEISPFISRDGSTIYFSSNRPSSIGGYDIFKSVFEVGRQAWNQPQNLGEPINSGKDDVQLRLGKGGLKGYFTSNRPGGQGDLDIYIIYFKNYLPEQQSEKIISSLVPLTNQDVENLPSTNEVFADSQIKKYSIPPVFYDDNDRIITPSNLTALNQAVQILSDNPSIQLELVGCSDLGSSIEFDLYFSIKRAEEVADFLIEKGISGGRIIARGVGQNFPLVKHMVNNQPVLLGKKLNRRVDFIFKNTNGLPIEISTQYPDVNNPQLEMPGSKALVNQAKGISYRVKVALTENMYNGSIITDYPDPMIDKPSTRNQYRYTVGTYNTFQSALFMKNDLIKKGVSNAEIIAFIDGNEVDKDAALPFVDQYPDLVNFLVHQ